jgi:tryptophan synthase beta chain
VTDKQAIEAAFLLGKQEGIIPALESAHALAYLNVLLPETSSDEIIILNLSGRGDKDMKTYIHYLEEGRERKEMVSG